MIFWVTETNNSCKECDSGNVVRSLHRKNPKFDLSDDQVIIGKVEIKILESYTRRQLEVFNYSDFDLIDWVLS